MTREPANTTGTSDGARDGDGEPVRYTVLSRRTIVMWAVLIVATGVGVAVWLLLVYGNGDNPRVQLDAIRTAGTLVVGAGGAAALLLAARRQRSTEIALKQKDRDQLHQERVAAATEADAAARRITELYTKAVEQLGSAQAPVRLGGLYALERLAQDHPDQRQTIVHVWCAYLRMPYTVPGDPPADHPDYRVLDSHRERVQEREVRLTAQRLLAEHLRPGLDITRPIATFWADIDLDLTGATLFNFNLGNCRVGAAWFNGAVFTGRAVFAGASLADAQFVGAEFTEGASFYETKFIGSSQFVGASFTGDAHFTGAEFTGHAWFSGPTPYPGLNEFRGLNDEIHRQFDDAKFERGVPHELVRFFPRIDPPGRANED